MEEPGHERLIEVIEQAEVVVVGVPTLLETVMLLTSRLGHDARPVVFEFLRRVEAELVAFHDMHLDAAIAAFLRFGRGRHPAGLKSGDCLAYVLAAAAGQPPLCTGEDFAQTDIPRA